MKTLNDVYFMAEEYKVRVDCYNLPDVKSMSYMSEKGNCYIAIDAFQLENEQDEKMKIVHELGHCVTGSFYNLYSKFDIRQKHENRADRWVIKNLVSFEELNEAICNGIYTIWELAEYFDYSEQFIKCAIDYYTNTRGFRFGNPNNQISWC